MDTQWDTRPLSVMHRTRDWQEPVPSAAGPSSISPPSAFPSPLSARRRSSAVNVPPAGPPPTQPIPSLPPVPTSPTSETDAWEFDEEAYSPHVQHNGIRNGYAPYGRPGMSAGLSAVAAFSQRNATSNASSPSPSSDNLSDPPPRSILPTASSSRAVMHHQEIVPDRLLLSPPEPRAPAEARPSSRRALTRALELAREAVKLDSTNDDPYAAVMAYGRSVSLLSEVMERVRRGEDSTESTRKRNGRRRSVVAQEEEVRRLKSIHDTYADRMNILSLIYSIPPIPHSPTAVYNSSMAQSAESTSPSSPTSASPTSDASEPTPQTPAAYAADHSQGDPRLFLARNGAGEHLDDSNGTEAIGSAMFADTSDNLVSINAPSKVAVSYHPYAAPDHNPPAQAYHHHHHHTHAVAHSPPPPTTRSSQLFGRARASSNLPPPPPPPSNALPPAPDYVVPEQLPEPMSSRAKYLDIGTNGTSHSRTGSGSRLSALREEDRYDEQTLQNQQQHHFETEDELRAPPPRTSALNVVKRESHPLPPLPSANSDAGSDGTPRNSMAGPPMTAPLAQQRSEPLIGYRSEGWLENQATIRGLQDALINPTPIGGTLYQRRSKFSAPPSSSASPVDPAMSAPNTAPIPASSLPSGAIAPLVPGRSRSSSQPGRRPSLINGRVSPFDQRPPLPQAAQNGTVGPRKTSYSSSKLNLTIQPPQLYIQTDSGTPLGSAPAGLVPPLAYAPNLPTTPTSPLPPAPPPDALRKPYHMMNLLRNTMTSKTGGYVTRRLHVPHEVWSQGGAKLNNVLEKVRVVEVLCSALEDLQLSSVDHFGAGNVSAGMAMGIGSVGRKQGDAWAAKLEEFSLVCDGVVANFGKKLGVGEGFVLKKTTGVTAWGGILARKFDKVTKGKNLDSPAAYVQGLTKLFAMAQLLDEHTKALCSVPIAPLYATLPADIRSSIEPKLKRSSEFFASVVLTFVIRDLSQLLDKYAKKCEKWLEE